MICMYLPGDSQTSFIPYLSVLWHWQESYLLDMNKKNCYSPPSPHFIHLTRWQLVCIYTSTYMSLSRIRKHKHTSHCYYLLLDNLNIWIVSKTSREALKIATRTLILMHSNSVFHGICNCKKKDAFITGKSIL